MKKKTQAEYESELAIKNPTIKVIGKYVDMKTQIPHYCTVHNVVWDISPDSALRGSGCGQCKLERFRKKKTKTKEQYEKELKDKNLNVVLVGKYLKARMPTTHYCLNHGIIWEASPTNILKGYGCPACGSEKTRSKLLKSHEQYEADVAKSNPDIEVIGEYIDSCTSILHRCKLDGRQWMAKPCNILSGKGCPVCQESKGERVIRQLLRDYKVQYISQYKFLDCKDQRPLPFDFYLPEYNTCIEYDGEQHFFPVDFSGKDAGCAEQQFKITQYHDKIKNQYCADNGITLLRIPYFKNIEEELDNFFIHLV